MSPLAICALTFVGAIAALAIGYSYGRRMSLRRDMQFLEVTTGLLMGIHKSLAEGKSDAHLLACSVENLAQTHVLAWREKAGRREQTEIRRLRSSKKYDYESLFLMAVEEYADPAQSPA